MPSNPADIDATDLFSDFDESQLSGLIDLAEEQITYHRDRLLYWRNMKSRLETLQPRSPVEEMAVIAEDAWTQSG